MQTQQLTEQFGIPNILAFEDDPGGLTRAVISTPAATADLYLQGAHLSHWTPRGQRPVLYVSPKSPFATGKPIRGGVPIIFPWFGPRRDGKPGPAHGFARTTEWTLEAARLLDDSRLEIALSLGPSETTRDDCPDFHLRFRVVIGAELEMELEARNLSREPFSYEEALHTYFAVGDIRQVSVSGLEGTTYIDKTDEARRKQQASEPIRFAKETDQVHVNTQSTCAIHDAEWKRRIVIQKTGSDSTVVWNPWIDKSAVMPDMVADGWQQMLCVESGNIADNTISLAPAECHKLTATVKLG